MTSAPMRAITRVVPVAALRILVVLIAMYALFSLLAPSAFFTTSNLVSILIAAAGILLLATGMTVLIVAGQLDLSIGSQLILSAVIAAAVMNALADAPVPIVLVAGVGTGLLVGAGFGLINGLVVTRLKVPSLIVTLGTLGIGLGFAQMLTSAGGSTSFPAPKALTQFGLSRPLGIPAVVWVSIAAAVIVGVILARTRFGLYCYAVGSNLEGSRRAGVPSDRVLIKAFVLMGLLSGLAGVLELSRFQTVSVAGHAFDAVTAIAAVIIGGASLRGGRGTIVGTAIGTLIPVVLLQGFVILGVTTSWQNVAIGVVLIAAVAVDQFDRTRRRTVAEVAAAEEDTHPGLDEPDAPEASDGPDGPGPTPDAPALTPSGQA